MSRLNNTPPPVNRVIDEKVLENWEHAEVVRIRDPEGTDFSFELPSEDIAKTWAEAAFFPNHHFVYPSLAFANMDTETFEKYMWPIFESTSGTIAGVSNHTGYYPNMELTIERGQVVDVEGGGKYGQLFEEWRERLSDVQYPPLPDSGWFYLHECAIATLPKGFRHSYIWETSHPLANGYVRQRAGVIHFGFGPQLFEEDWKHTASELVELGREHDVPVAYGNFVHNFFTTIEIKRRDTGEWMTVIDKGRLTALDDPVTRTVASTYGDPDEMLRYDWVPKIPGINAPGEYETDYAPDPVRTIKEEVRGYVG